MVAKILRTLLGSDRPTSLQRCAFRDSLQGVDPGMPVADYDISGFRQR